MFKTAILSAFALFAATTAFAAGPEAGTPAPLYDPLDPMFLPLQHASSVKRSGPRIRIWRLTGP